MDAQKAKILSGVVVALFVGSVLVPFATAQDADLTDAPDVVVDVGAAHTWTSGSTTYNGYVSGGPITYNSTWDLTVTNLTGSLNQEFILNASGGSNQAKARAVQDKAHPGKVNVTFASTAIGADSGTQKFDQVGEWAVWDGATKVATFKVNATENLQVTLSKSTMSYTRDNVALRVTVTNEDGTPAKGVTVDFGELITGYTLTTNADGIVDFSGSAQQAGEYTIKATKSTTGDSQAEFEGKATLTVTAAPLGVKSISTDVLRGFDGKVSTNFTLPGSVFPVALHSIAAGVEHNVDDVTFNLTHGGEWIVFTYNPHTMAFTKAAAGTAQNTWGNDTVGSDDPSLAVYQGQTSERGNINVTLASGQSWGSGTYTLHVFANEEGTALGAAYDAKKAEYSGSTSWAPGSPADVNLRISGGTTSEGKIDAVSAPASGEGLPATADSVEIQVVGSNINQHPTGGWDAFTTAKNVTVEGDFLVITDADGNQLAPSIGAIDYSTGKFTVSNLYPTEGSGSITVNVNWKNQTTSKTIPIGNGAGISVDAENVVVDTASTVTFTLRGPSGAVDAFGKVNLYRYDAASSDTVAIKSAVKSLSGDGTDGRGLDGQYKFTLNEDELGTYIAHGIVGQSPYVNHTYTTFRVVPAHDLQSEIVSGSEGLGSDTFTVSVNVTKADGGVYGTTDTTEPQVYVLNAGQLATFQANGALPSSWNGETGPVAAGSLVPYSEGGKVKSYNFSYSSVNPDVYTVYVRSPDKKHDNSADMPSFQVHHARVSFSPSGVVANKDIQANTTITVDVTDWAGKALNGTLIWDVQSKGGAWFYGSNVTGTVTQPKIKVEEGKATFNVTGFKLGSIRWGFDPASTSSSLGYNASTDALGTFEIVTPNVIVEPKSIPVGQLTQVTITVKDLSDQELSGLKVQVCGPPIGGGCTGNETTGADGTARLGVQPLVTGNLTLRVGGNSTGTNIVVYAGLVISATPSTPTVGDDVVLKIGKTGREAESGVTVSVARADNGAEVFTGTTDSLGLAKWTADEAGAFTITAEKAGFETATAEISVSEPEPEAPEPQAAFGLEGLQVSPSTIELGSDAMATVTVKNTGDGEGTTTVRLKVGGVTVSSQQVSLGAGQQDTIGLAFTPTQADTFQISVALPDGTEAGPVSLTVNTPAEPEPPAQPPANPPTGNQGQENPDGVPGFTAFIALAAIGAALVLVRRRN